MVKEDPTLSISVDLYVVNESPYLHNHVLIYILVDLDVVDESPYLHNHVLIYMFKGLWPKITNL
jgi:hypothetical protein